VLHDGELFVVGRLKDVVIVDGRKLHLHEVECEAIESHAALRSSLCAAFGVPIDGTERLVLIVEKPRGLRDDPARLLTPAIRRAISEEHGVRVHDIVYVQPGRIPRTTSGKIQRLVCRADYLRGQAPALVASPKEQSSCVR
jgi:acyl-CoA synthetase (AMP-forming)/AMP-acid ligase II